MPDRNFRRSRAGRGVGRQQPAQEATLAREQANRATEGSETRTLKEKKGRKPTITLQDGAVVEADMAVCAWNLLQNFPQEEPAAFRSLLAMAQGQHPVDADARQFEALLSRNFVNEDGTLNPVTRVVLLNSFTTVDGAPMIAALRLRSTGDRTVLEEARAQFHQNYSEGSARWVSPGGGRDQLWEKIQRERGKGRSID